MKHISIYWQNNSDELVRFLHAHSVGVVCGNDGHEIAVTAEELDVINDYISENPGKLTVEIYDTTAEKLAEMIESWKGITDG